jgi:O-antigen/teichoic acid export membrane protein
MEVTAQVVGLGVTVTWAWISPTIFAVSGGALASTVTRSALTHVLFSGVRNRLFWSSEQFRHIFSFGRWVFLSSILGFLVTNGDRLLLGGILGASKFGIYAIAAMIVNAVFGLGGRLISTVMYPALNETYRVDPKNLKLTYYRMRAPIEAASSFMAGALICAGPAMIGFLYDPRYAPAGPVVQILAIPMILIGLNAASDLYMIIGKPWLVSILIAVRTVTLFVAVPPLALVYGLPGGALGVVAGHLMTVPVNYYFTAKHDFLCVRREFIGIPFLGVGLLAGMGIAAGLNLFHR